MVTITIPRTLTQKGDLVIIPKKEYESFLRLSGKIKAKKYTLLDKELDEAIASYRAGKYYGPFETSREGITFLNSKRIRK